MRFRFRRIVQQPAWKPRVEVGRGIFIKSEGCSHLVVQMKGLGHCEDVDKCVPRRSMPTAVGCVCDLRETDDN